MNSSSGKRIFPCHLLYTFSGPTHDAQITFPCLERMSKEMLSCCFGRRSQPSPLRDSSGNAKPTLFSFGEPGATVASSEWSPSDAAHHVLNGIEEHHKGINGIVLLFILVLLASQKSASVRPAIARIFQ